MNVNVCARYVLTALGFVVALLAPARGAAQGEATIAGTVTDSSTRTPVPGVQITIAGTARGTLTDDGGRYALRGVPAGTVSLRVQRLGYAPVERSVAVSAGQTADVDFVLTPVARVLTEVVATGYGTSIRRELSSSVSSLQAEEVQNAAVAGVDAALQGKAPGVQVIQNSGNPGVGITVRVRGASSISASNQPLWVIDGVPMIREDFSQIAVGGQDITAVTGISPDEIESIDILKDAASAAIYGSRAANGVVMIRTKRGRAGTPRFSFNLYTGMQETAKKLELLNSREFVEFANEAFTNDGYAPEDLPFIPGEDDVINTDWQDAVLRNAPVNDVSLSVDGGNERIRYLVGGSYFDQRGIVLGSGYDRQTIRANLDFDPTNRLSFRSSLALSRELHERIENDNTIEGVYANAIANLPMFPVRQPDGRYTNTNDVVGQYDDVPLTYINPVAVADLSFNESRSLRSYGTIEGSFRINDQFRLNARAGYDVLNLRDLTWESPNVIGSLGESVRGRAVQANNTATRYMLESYLGYDYTGGFSLNLTGGASVEWNNAENDFLRGEGFAHTAFQYPGNAGRVTTYDGDRTGHNLVSFFGRVNATFADRYLFSGSIRADGSSRFGAENRYGYFPAVSVGWIMSDEPAFEGLRRYADVKLRASYGETGNQDIGDDFAPIARYSEAKYAGAPGIAPENIANQELKWETNREYDVGIDVGMFDGRVNLVADWYLKETDDLLILRPITRTTGFDSFWDNIGNIENQGLEFGITTVNLDPPSDGLRWETNFNISWNKNKVTSLYNHEPFNSGFDDVNRYEEGAPMGAFYTVKFIGVDPETGNAMFFDLDGDGETGEDSDDRMIVGSPHPDYWGGLTNTFSFRGFDLRAFVQFSQGAEIYNGLRAYADDGVWSLGDNKLRHVLKRWRQPGDITDVPRPSWDGVSQAYIASSRWIEDASYIRLQEITLGYKLPMRFASRANLADARIFVSGRNLKTWSDFMGFNPEANSAGSSSLTTMSNEFYSYPLARTITVGVQGSF